MQMFAEGGPSMYLIFAVDLFVPVFVVGALIASIASRATGRFATPTRIFAFLVLLMSLLPGCVGLAGWQYGILQVNEALQAAPPDMRVYLEMEGRRLAQIPLQCGCGSALVLGIPAAVAILIAPRPQARWEDLVEDE